MKASIKGILFTLVMIFVSIGAYAQDMDDEKVEVLGKDPLIETNDVGILYKYERTFGLFSHSNGFGMNFRKGTNTTGYTKRILEIEVATIKHSKEHKRYHESRESKGYIFGKSNAFLTIRSSIGEQRVIASKTDMGGIEIRYIYMVGASLGILKPIYLKILQDVPGSTTKVDIVTEKYDPAKHGTYNIYGKAPVLKGIDELKLVPGGFAKFGMSFEYGNEVTKIRSLEIGMMLDVYYKQVPIMAELDPSFNPNNFFFFGFYVSLNYGKRW